MKTERWTLPTDRTQSVLGAPPSVAIASPTLQKFKIRQGKIRIVHGMARVRCYTKKPKNIRTEIYIKKGGTSLQLRKVSNTKKKKKRAHTHTNIPLFSMAIQTITHPSHRRRKALKRRRQSLHPILLLLSVLLPFPLPQQDHPTLAVYERPSTSVAAAVSEQIPTVATAPPPLPPLP